MRKDEQFQREVDELLRKELIRIQAARAAQLRKQREQQEEQVREQRRLERERRHRAAEERLRLQKEERGRLEEERRQKEIQRQNEALRIYLREKDRPHAAERARLLREMRLKREAEEQQRQQERREAEERRRQQERYEAERQECLLSAQAKARRLLLEFEEQALRYQNLEAQARAGLVDTAVIPPQPNPDTVKQVIDDYDRVTAPFLPPSRRTQQQDQQQEQQPQSRATRRVVVISRKDRGNVSTRPTLIDGVTGASTGLTSRTRWRDPSVLPKVQQAEPLYPRLKSSGYY